MIFAVIVENRAYIPGTRFRGKCSTQGKCASDRQSAERRIVEAPSSPHKRFPNPEAHFRELFDRVPDEERPRHSGRLRFPAHSNSSEVRSRRRRSPGRLPSSSAQARRRAARRGGRLRRRTLPFMVHEDEAVRRHRERRNVHRSFHCLVDLPTTYQPANTLLVGWQVPGRLQTIMIYGTYPRQVLDARKVRVRPTERRTENRRSALIVTQAFSKSRSVL